MLAAVLPLTGCTPYVCPAVGYASTLVVEVSGANRDRVALVEVCNADGCTETLDETLEPICIADPESLDLDGSQGAGDDELASNGPLAGEEGVDPAQCDEAPESSKGESVLPLAVLNRQPDGNWSTDFFDGSVGPYTVRGYDESGTVIAERSIADLEWVRIGGTPQCGGPTTTAIDLPVS